MRLMKLISEETAAKEPLLILDPRGYHVRVGGAWHHGLTREQSRQASAAGIDEHDTCLLLETPAQWPKPMEVEYKPTGRRHWLLDGQPVTKEGGGMGVQKNRDDLQDNPLPDADSTTVLRDQGAVKRLHDGGRGSATARRRPRPRPESTGRPARRENACFPLIANIRAASPIGSSNSSKSIQNAGSRKTSSPRRSPTPGLRSSATTCIQPRFVPDFHRSAAGIDGAQPCWSPKTLLPQIGEFV